MNGSAHNAAAHRRLLSAACALLVAFAAADAAAKPPAQAPRPAPAVRERRAYEINYVLHIALLGE